MTDLSQVCRLLWHALHFKAGFSSDKTSVAEKQGVGVSRLLLMSCPWNDDDCWLWRKPNSIVRGITFAIDKLPEASVSFNYKRLSSKERERGIQRTWPTHFTVQSTSTTELTFITEGDFTLNRHFRQSNLIQLLSRPCFNHNPISSSISSDNSRFLSQCHAFPLWYFAFPCVVLITRNHPSRVFLPLTTSSSARDHRESRKKEEQVTHSHLWNHPLLFLHPSLDHRHPL